MDRAARAVRRSSVKLMSLGGGHTDLHVLLSEVKDMRQAAKTFMNAQNAVSQDLLKWAANEENRALQDVANQLAELNLLWTEVQREFGESLKDYRHMFEMVLEGEKHVSQSRNHFTVCEQREMKIRKELKKAFKKAPSAEIQCLEGRLAQAERAKHLAQLEVTDRVRENEAVKLIRLKEGLMKMSQAYSDFARKCSVVFDAQQDIVQELPDVLDQDLEDLKYTGTGVTRHCVQQAKERVRNYRTRKEYFQIPQKYNEPPPPYSLTSNDYYGDPDDQSIPSPQTLQTSSPRRRISTATTNTTHLTDSFDASSSSSSSLSKQQQQQQRCGDGDITDSSSIISSNTSGNNSQYHHNHYPHPQPQSYNPKGYEPIYPSLPFNAVSNNNNMNNNSISGVSNSNTNIVIMPTQPPISSSSSSSSTATTSVTDVKMTSSSTLYTPHPYHHPHHHHHHLPTYVALDNSKMPLSFPPPHHKMGPQPPPSSSAHFHQSANIQPPPPPAPPLPMEAAVPEVPADLRPVISKPPSYDDDSDCCDNDCDDNNAEGSGGSIIIINKEVVEGGGKPGGGGVCHQQIAPNSMHVQSAQNNIVHVGLVDFQPAWDDSYEEDLSGAMGGAKI